MTGTQVRQIRTTTNTGSGNLYVITANCIATGTLPDTSIFLLGIITPTDPKDDELVRVCQVGDFSNYLTSRPLTLNAGNVYWRSSSITLTYTSIDEADAAWKELSSRINALVAEVDAYNDSFETPETGIVTTYPAADEGVLNSLVLDYTTARDAVTAAEVAREEKQLEANEIQTALATYESELATAQTDFASLSAAQLSIAACQASLATVKTGLDSDVAATRSFNSLSSAIPGEKASIEAELRDMDGRLLTFGTQNAALLTSTATLAGLVSGLQTRTATLIGQRNAQQTAFTAANAEIAALQATVDTTRAARNAALAAILAIDSAFDPSTV